MSRTVRGRIVAVLAAYALVLQPITAAALTQGPRPGPVICSGVDPDNTPPPGHRQDIACCPSSCCGAPVEPRPPSAFLILPEAAAEFVPAAAPAVAPVRTHHPQSRAPPGALLTLDR
jgi:hypothetical protein